MTEIALNRDQYLEFEKLAFGALKPLDGFMNEDVFRGVVADMRLPNGEIFPLPVVLDLTREQAAAARGRPRLTLTFRGEQVGSLQPESFYACDKADVARRVFGTDEAGHPGVAHLFAMGEVFVGGRVEMSRRAELEFSDLELTPAETRQAFADRGWERVAGFQTRNVPHRAHEYLQRVALEYCDGLFIQPLVGRKKVGDYTPEAIIAGYRALIGRFFNRDHVMLGILSTSMRYAGPREALFHAIIRRNYGCTHFVVGRDHAGVGDYYGKYDAHALTRRFDGELGIEILRLHGPFHCRICDGIVTEQTCPHYGDGSDATHEISGTLIRAMLKGERKPDQEIMRPEIIDSLGGVKLFVDESDIADAANE